MQKDLLKEACEKGVETVKQMSETATQELKEFLMKFTQPVAWSKLNGKELSMVRRLVKVGIMTELNVGLPRIVQRKNKSTVQKPGKNKKFIGFVLTEFWNQKEGPDER